MIKKLLLRLVLLPAAGVLILVGLTVGPTVTPKAHAAWCAANGRHVEPRLYSNGKDPTKISSYGAWWSFSTSMQICPTAVYVPAFDDVRYECGNGARLTLYSTGWHQLRNSSNTGGACSTAGGSSTITFIRLD